MEEISRAVLTASTASVALTVLELIAPAKKFRKQLGLIFSMVFILFVFGPVLKNPPEIPELSAFSGSEIAAISPDEFILSETKKNIERELYGCFRENGYEAEEISVLIHTDENGGISISEVKITCRQGADLEAIEKLAREKTGVKALTLGITERTEG